jgi:leucyl-tRNA synthetase
MQTVDPETGAPAVRETNTMPQWAGSCWYYLRFLSPDRDDVAWDAAEEKYWMPVDLYVGGVEHAVLHLLYARFWHKVLFDLGRVSTKEPFQKLVNQGLILGEDGEKMSKSRGNVVNPDDVLKKYGADAFRLFEMFLGPLEAVKPWNTKGLEGPYRFLQRVWRLFYDEGRKGDEARYLGVAGGVHERNNSGTQDSQNQVSGEIAKKIHKTIQKVGDDIEKLRFNTAISSLMELQNALADLPAPRPRVAMETFVKLLSPFAPHVAEELWQAMGHARSIAYEPWPAFDPALTADAEIEYAVQVNGKVRGRVVVDAGADEESIRNAALGLPELQAALAGKPPRKIIVVPKKLVSIVV